MPASEIDFSGLTHIMHYTARPGVDGTLNLNHYYQATSAPDLISRAHAAGRKVIFVIGSANSAQYFRGATNSTNLSKFVSNIISVVKQYQYDGVDIDWETLDPGDATQYKRFIQTLRSELDKIYPRPELSAAVARGAEIIASIYFLFDQINVMAYDSTWPDLGISWHNAAVHSGGYTEPVWNSPAPTIQWRVNTFIKAGVPPYKLGLGVPFNGYVWTGGSGTVTGGVTMPGQRYATPPAMAGVDYNKLMSTVYTAANARRDTAALVPYLSFDEAGSASDRFVSYDDEVSIGDKVQYGRNAGLGGFMIWELAAAYFGNRPVGERHPLLSAITKARGGPVGPSASPLAPPPTTGDTTPPVRSSGVPWGTLGTGVTGVTISLKTNENATCRYSPTGGGPYSAMTRVFAQTGGTAHSLRVFGLARNQIYDYFVRCSDVAGNPNTSDYLISFLTAKY